MSRKKKLPPVDRAMLGAILIGAVRQVREENGRTRAMLGSRDVSEFTRRLIPMGMLHTYTIAGLYQVTPRGLAAI